MKKLRNNYLPPLFKLSFLLFCLLSGFINMAGNVNVLDMGAKPDGVALNTSIIQKAIDQCSQSGGGEVIFPQGKYLRGSISVCKTDRVHFSETENTFENPVWLNFIQPCLQFGYGSQILL